ncbi:MAG: hypothetical protein U9N48_00025 [Euryarchaeota archaeon]|nr:hypothetical protein [Euryarchaeota archaeon]
MRHKLILLSLLALVGLGSAGGSIALPASGDVYVDFGNGQVYDTNVLRCETGPTADTRPVAPLIKFNVSGLDLAEDDIGILVLKAGKITKAGEETGAVLPATSKAPVTGEAPIREGATIQNKEEPAVIIFPAGSNWSEGSDFVDLDLGLALDMIENEVDVDYSRIGVRFDNGGRIFAFDVAKHLKEKVSDELSFVLVAATEDLEYQVEFMSRETGEGPYILVISYPSEDDTKLDPPPRDDATG